MKFDDQHVDTGNLSDRRGGMGRFPGGGRGIGIGGGGIGLLALIIALLLGGGGGGTPFTGTEPPGQVSDVQSRCNQAGAIDTYDDCFVLKVFNEANEVWAAQLQGYQAPTLAYYEQAVATACGTATSQVGPFYCPGDATVYIDLGFMNQLQEQLGATGRYAQAYIVAHEVGHHLQMLTGTEQQVRGAQQANPGQANALSVAMELQADCYAGAWGRDANDQGNVQISQAEFQEAMNAAAAVGDDRIQIAASGRTDPETWTHGSAEQRQQWFGTGFSTGDPNMCNTFEQG